MWRKWGWKNVHEIENAEKNIEKKKTFFQNLKIYDFFHVFPEKIKSFLKWFDLKSLNHFFQKKVKSNQIIFLFFHV